MSCRLIHKRISRGHPPKRGYRQNPHGRSPPCPNCEKQAYLASWGRTARKSPQHQNHKSLEFRRFQITQEKRDAMKHTHFRPQPRDTGISCQLRPGRKPTIPTPKSQIVGIPPFSNHTRKTERDETYPPLEPQPRNTGISPGCARKGVDAHTQRGRHPDRQIRLTPMAHDRGREKPQARPET